MYEKRIKKIFDGVKDDLDLIVIKNSTCIDHTFFYVTGLASGLFEGSYALLHPNGSLEIITSVLEEQSARKGGFRVTIYKNRDELAKLIRNRLSKVKRVGLNFQSLVHSDYIQIKKYARRAKISDVSESVCRARAVKDADEISLVTKACKITSRIADEIPAMLKRGVREYEVCAEIVHRMQQMGAEGCAFNTIVAFGPHCAEPHFSCGSAKLKDGDFVVTDFGARYMRYCADITRTYVFGKPTKRHKDLYEFVYELQELALDEIRAGSECKTVQDVVDKAVSRSKFKGKFTHGIGHSIGLQTHDGIAFTHPPGLIQEENMVMTVEPGIYVNGWGGARIEDDVVITKSGYRMLTGAKKDFDEICV